MKKRIRKIAAFVFAIALIVGVCVFANALVGNPISKAMATNTAETHIEENYADMLTFCRKLCIIIPSK